MSQPTAQSNTPLPESTTKPQYRGWTPLSSRLNPFLPPIFITLILLIGNLSFGILESYSKTLLAIATAIAFEMVLGRIFLHKWPHPASSYITGISVGILLRSPAFWPYALCSALSITSKYALRVRGRHIWNPSNFGICAMLILASQSVASLSIQWGNNFASLVVIWVLGSVIVWRAKRLPYHSDLCGLLFGAVVSARASCRRSVAGGDRAHHGAHVSTVHLFHDHRPEDDGALAYGPVCGRRCYRGARILFPARQQHLCATLRALLGWTGGPVD